MKPQQRDIVEISFPTGHGDKPHPAVVISKDEVFETEGFFIAVMLSTKYYNDGFIFEIRPDMFVHNTDITSYAKCQLVNVFWPEDILKRIGSIKKGPFQNLIRKINTSVFGVE